MASILSSKKKFLNQGKTVNKSFKKYNIESNLDESDDEIYRIFKDCIDFNKDLYETLCKRAENHLNSHNYQKLIISSKNSWIQHLNQKRIQIFCKIYKPEKKYRFSRSRQILSLLFILPTGLEGEIVKDKKGISYKSKQSLRTNEKMMILKELIQEPLELIAPITQLTSTEFGELHLDIKNGLLEIISSFVPKLQNKNNRIFNRGNELEISVSTIILMKKAMKTLIETKNEKKNAAENDFVDEIKFELFPGLDHRNFHILTKNSLIRYLAYTDQRIGHYFNLRNNGIIQSLNESRISRILNAKLVNSALLTCVLMSLGIFFIVQNNSLIIYVLAGTGLAFLIIHIILTLQENKKRKLTFQNIIWDYNNLLPDQINSIAEMFILRSYSQFFREENTSLQVFKKKNKKFQKIPQKLMNMEKQSHFDEDSNKMDKNKKLEKIADFFSSEN